MQVFNIYKEKTKAPMTGLVSEWTVQRLDAGTPQWRSASG